MVRKHSSSLQWGSVGPQEGGQPRKEDQDTLQVVFLGPHITFP